MPDHPTPQTPDAFLAALRAGHFDAIADQAEPILRSASAHPRAIREQADRLAAVLKRDVVVHDEPYGLTWTNGQGTQVLVALPVPLPESAPDELDEDPELADEDEPDDAPCCDTPQDADEDDDDDEGAAAAEDEVDDETEDEVVDEAAAEEPADEPVAAEAVEPAASAPETPVDPDGVGTGRFFRGSAPLTAHGPITLVLAREGGSDSDPLLRATLIPTAGSDDTKAYAQPFTVVATASELDAGYLDLIGAAIDGNRGIHTALEELKAAKEAEKAAQKAATAAAKKKTEKAAPKSAAAPAKPAEPAPPAEPPAPSLFPPAN